MDSPTLPAGHCYCGALEAEQHMLECQKCRKLFHPGCLTSGRPSNIVGDTYFNFTCSLCSSSGTEEIERSKLLWTHVILLTLYNLRLQGGGKCGFYRWREHICNFIDRNWSTFFGSARKKSSTWHCTVAGTLSANCPQLFQSGISVLKESGWWALVDSHLPSPTELEILLSSQKVGKKSKPSVQDSPPKVGGLRLRSSKTPIQAAIELKERRSELQEAKDIRKARSPNLIQDVTIPALSTSMTESFTEDAEPLNSLVAAENPSFEMDVNTLKDESVSSANADLNTSNNGTSDCNVKEEVPSMKMENGVLSSDNLFKDSEIPLVKEEIVKEKEITDLSCLLHAEEEMEFDVDPSNIESPAMLTQSELPAVEDLLSTFSYMDENAIDIAEEVCIKDEPESEDEKPFEERELSTAGSEDEGTSGSHPCATTVPEVGRKRKAVSKEEPVNKENDVPQPKCQLMSIYEEQQLLKKLESMTEAVEKNPVARRLRRKLIVRKLKREQNIPVFNLDAQVRMLCGFQQLEDVQNDVPENIVPVTNRQATHILDRYQNKHYIACGTSRHCPNFVTRLMGLEDEEESIISPYTERILKPYIFRDYETVPMKLRLLKEIIAYPHRNDKNWIPPPHHPIDYCYVRAQHIPVVHSICREFFWPGIDLNDCLKFPDFSCIALYRKIVIGFAFMVPDSSYNEAYITFIFTHPEWRRAGIATFMLYHLIQTCMGKDVTLHVAVTNPALLLYQKFGFKVEELIKDFYDKYLPADSKECRHALFLRLSR